MHGENIYNVGNSKGRKHNLTEKDKDLIRCLYEEPFVVWFSDKYKKANKKVVSDMYNSKDKPMMTDNLCHLLMRVGGVHSDSYKSTRDILSPDYKCPPRMISNLINYDDLR